MKTLPNVLTGLRLIIIPTLILLFFTGSYWSGWLAFALYIMACLSDFFDGYFARKWQQCTAFGQCMDPIADKCLVITILFLLTASGQIYGMFLIAALLILLRETLVSGMRIFLAGKSVVLPSSKLAKWKTTVQMFSLGFYLLAAVTPARFYMQAAGELLILVASVLTVITGVQYVLGSLPYFTPSRTE